MDKIIEVDSSIETKQKEKNVIMLIIKIALIVIFATIAVFAGTVVGDLVIGKFDTFDPNQFNAENYVENATNVKLWRTQSINSLTATQIFVVAESKILECENYCIHTKGYNGEDKGKITTLGITQDLYGYRYRKNNKGYFDYFSTGLATVAKKVEYTVGENKYYCYEGAMSGGSTTWVLFPKDDGTEYRNGSEYKELTGCYAENPIDYIVSTKTVLTQTTNEKVDDFYSYTITLDTQTSVLNYVRKMDYMSNFGYPKFSSIELRFEVDENMNFRNIYISENYKVIGMEASAKFKMEFSYENIEER